MRTNSSTRCLANLYSSSASAIVLPWKTAWTSASAACVFPTPFYQGGHQGAGDHQHPALGEGGGRRGVQKSYFSSKLWKRVERLRDHPSIYGVGLRAGDGPQLCEAAYSAHQRDPEKQVFPPVSGSRGPSCRATTRAAAASPWRRRCCSRIRSTWATCSARRRRNICCSAATRGRDGKRRLCARLRHPPCIRG